MRLNSTRLVAPAIALAAVASACRDSSRDATSTDALQRDLALASAGAVALAPTARDLPPTRFVSALEAGTPARDPGTTPKATNRRANKAPSAHQHHAPPAPVAVASAGESSAAEAPAPERAPEASPVATADAGPAPSENPTHGPNDGVISVSPTDGGGDGGAVIERRRGGGIGGAIGGIIGVVIRGGSIGDDDHCERDRPGGRGRIGRGTPGGMPIGFPGRSGGMSVPRRGGGFGGVNF